MAAYYNEHDPKAAAWLRELTYAGLIAPGDVDERDIRDVRPDELAGYTQCHFFAGIGVWSYALRLAGWRDDVPVWTGSCPCQPFSAAGKRTGTADERHLWPAWFHLVEQRSPVTLFGEQVASNDGLGWLDVVRSDLEGASYTVGSADLCAAGFGAPHIRQRLFFVADSNGGNAGAEGLQRCGQHRQFAADSLARELADDLGRGRAEFSATRIHDQRSSGDHTPGCSEARDLANASRRGCGKLRNASQPRSGGHVDGSVDANRLGYPNSERARQYAGKLPAHEEKYAQWGEAGDHSSVAASSTRDVDNPNRARLERYPRDGDAQPGWNDAHRSASAPSVLGGFWADADWIYCRDNKWRPVEPGTFPLAHGAPARVVRLRGYGNSIVAPVAVQFIKGYIDTLHAR